MLVLHRSARNDALIAALHAVLAVPGPDPLAPEVVAVPTRGVERWVAQQLSTRLGTAAGRADGVAANLAFPSLRTLTGDAVTAASGTDPDADPWRPERMVWPLLDVVDACLDEPWLHALATHLRAGAEGEGSDRRARRFATVRHIAELLDRYGLHRPELVRGWVDGADAGRWQAELWRRLRARLDTPSPAERRDAACARLVAEPGIVDLPARVTLFGLTRLPAGHLAVLRALAAHRDVHLLLLHPSPALWDRVAAATRDRPPIVRRAQDPTVALPTNRLLASWGHDARELQLVLSADADAVDHHHDPAPQDHDAPATLLARVQRDVAADVQAPGPPLPGEADTRAVLAAGDRSVQVHAAHGRSRQVEVLREAILHELAADPTLEPRDVIVLCPDIEAFAPLIHATFGAVHAAQEDDDEEDGPPPDPDAPPDLRVRLADRSLRQTNPVLGVVAQLLDLATQRLTASQVLDLADRAPVRRRFGLDDDDVARLEDWVAASGIRWGLDAEHRAPFRLDGLAAGTWRAGLDRVLVGATMTEQDARMYEAVLPLDDVDSGAVDLAGRFAELVDRLHAAVDALSAPQSLPAWARALATAADALTATAPRDAWQRAELQRVLDEEVAHAAVTTDPEATRLTRSEVRALLAQRLQGRPTRASFRTGHLTACTLVPMRSVPHRVVCLLGLDDAEFPRKAPRDGDDLMLQDPHVGDRDPRSEDRQLLLDALMAATDRLIITYTGNDERTNAPRPPAVPVGELLDVLERTARTADGTAVSERVVVRHPLQPFDPRNFAPGHLTPDGPWGFDTIMLDGATAVGRARPAAPAFLPAPLPAEPLGPVLELDDLVRFVERPARAFLRQRLGISLAADDDEPDDALSVELDALQRWGVGQRLLDAVLAGTDVRVAGAAEVARGTLPPGNLALQVLARVGPTVRRLADEAQRRGLTATPPASLDVRAPLADGRRLSGTVSGVHGDVLQTITYSRINPRHRAAAWVALLALSATRPERPFSAVLLGQARRGAQGAQVTHVRLPPLGDDAATRRARALDGLAVLADLHRRGLREPLPLVSLTSAAYVEAAHAGGGPEHAAGRAWTSTYGFAREDRDPEHLLVFGGRRTIEELLGEPPRADESGPDWAQADATRLGRLARRLWEPLLAHEELEDR